MRKKPEAENQNGGGDVSIDYLNKIIQEYLFEDSNMEDDIIIADRENLQKIDFEGNQMSYQLFAENIDIVSDHLTEIILDDLEHNVEIY
jgi:hypothetical protein